MDVLLGLSLLVAAGYAVVLAALHPRATVLALIPICVWPVTLEVAGIPITVPCLALAFLGVMISSKSLPAPQMLLWIFAAVVVAVAVSVAAHAPTRGLLPSEARNSAATLVLALSLVVTYAKIDVPMARVLRWLATSLAVSATYLALTGSIAGGRLIAESTNSNAAGYIAAEGVLACLLCRQQARRPFLWTLLAVPSLYVLYSAQSRGALTALLVGLAVWTVVSLDGSRRVVVALLASAAALALWGPARAFASDVLLAERSQRFVESDSRSTLLELARDSFLQSPLGIGYARFLDVSVAYFGVSLNTHNDWVRLFVEGGFILGVAALVLVPGRLLVKGISPDASRAKALLAVGCVAFLFSNTMTDLRVSAAAFMCAGLLWGAAARKFEESVDDSGHPDVRGAVAAGGVVRR